MLVARAADHQRARRAGHAVGAECELVIEPHRHGLAAAHPQVDVEHFGLDFARHRHDRGQQRGAVAGDDVGQLQPARADLGEVVIEPVRQRGVDIDELAGGIDREEAARRVIEIFDRVLQFLEHVLLALAVAGDVGNRPHRIFRLALALRRAAGPASAASGHGAVGAGNADFLLLALAFARGLEQAEHRLRDVGIADEDPFDRPNLPSFHGAWTLGGCSARRWPCMRRPADLGHRRRGRRAARGGLRAVPAGGPSSRSCPATAGPRALAPDHAGRAGDGALLHGRHGGVHVGTDVPRPGVHAPVRPGRPGDVPLLAGERAVRLAGDDLVAPVRRGAGCCASARVVASAALAVIVFAPTWPVAVLGFTILGGGVAVVAPLSFSAAARIAGGDEPRPGGAPGPGRRGDRAASTSSTTWARCSVR